MKYKLKLEHALYFLGVLALVAIIGLFVFEKVKADPPSIIATVSSDLYTVSTVGGGVETITNVPYGTSSATLLSHLTKDDPLETWSWAMQSDPIATGDSFVSRAEDVTVSITYTITVDDPSSDATVSSASYTIVPTIIRSVDDISNIPFETSQATFLADLTANAVGQTQDVSNLTDPVVTDNALIVTAQDGMTTMTYHLTVDGPVRSSDTTILSTAYTVNIFMRAGGTITDVPYGTSKATFQAALTKGQIAQTWDVSAIHDPVRIGDALVVTAEDTTQYTYTVTDINDPVPRIISSGSYSKGSALPATSLPVVVPVVENPAVIPTTPDSTKPYWTGCPPDCVGENITPNSPMEIIKNLQTILNEFVGPVGKLILFEGNAASKLIATDGTGGNTTGTSGKLIAEGTYGKLILFEGNSDSKLIAQGISGKLIAEGTYGKVAIPLKIDGIIGPKTATAVKTFQELNGLTVDGKPGTKTINALKTADYWTNHEGEAGTLPLATVAQ